MATVILTPAARHWTPGPLPRPRLERRLCALLILLGLLLSSPAAHLWVTSESVTVGSSIERLRGERDQWAQQNRQLEFELSKLQSLAWVETEATARLGMRRTMPMLYLSVNRPLAPPAQSAVKSMARSNTSRRLPSTDLAQDPAIGNSLEISSPARP
jgi:cell division protein FtsL